MSFLEKIVGKKQAPLTPVEAIQRLRETEDLLVKKQEHLESKINNEYLAAKRNATKNKPAAILALKRRKRYEKQLQRIDNTLTTIEMQREALEAANTNTTILKTMRNAAHALRNAHLNIDIDRINNMVDDIADQQDLANEIANVLSSPLAFNEDIDEDELEKELEALEDEEFEEKLLEVPHLQVLPMVPSEEVKKSGPSRKKLEESDEDIKKLQKWASQ